MRVQVAVGILHRAGPQLLIQQRRAATDCAGQWEFPGGKIETKETPQAALARELKEELNIEILSTSPLIEHCQNYPHANVTLHTFMVDHWQGEPVGFEGQNIRWVSPDESLQFDLLKGAYPLLTAARQRLINTS